MRAHQINVRTPQNRPLGLIVRRTLIGILGYILWYKRQRIPVCNVWATWSVQSPGHISVHSQGGIADMRPIQH